MRERLRLGWLERYTVGGAKEAIHPLTPGQQMAPHSAPGSVCPYRDCQGLIPDLWAEWSADLLGVASGTTAIDCYYCGRSIVYNWL
jgi:hypothetical protein